MVIFGKSDDKKTNLDINEVKISCEYGGIDLLHLKRGVIVVSVISLYV